MQNECYITHDTSKLQFFLFLTLFSGKNPGSTQGIRHNARNHTWISCMQGKYLIYCSICLQSSPNCNFNPITITSMLRFYLVFTKRQKVNGRVHKKFTKDNEYWQYRRPKHEHFRNNPLIYAGLCLLPKTTLVIHPLPWELTLSTKSSLTRKHYRDHKIS